MLRSEANLVASLNAHWGEQQKSIARKILSRIAAEEDARTSREVRCALPSKPRRPAREAETLFGARMIYGLDGDIVRLICPAGKVAEVADWLIERGAQNVTVSALDYVFSAVNPLYEKLLSRIDAGA